MFESIKHFKQLPDPKFNDYYISLRNCQKNGYKRYIERFSNIDFSKIKFEDYKIILKQIVQKYETLTKTDITSSKNAFNQNFSQQKLIEIQKSLLSSNKILILNTSCLWPIDYYNESFYKKILL